MTVPSQHVNSVTCWLFSEWRRCIAFLDTHSCWMPCSLLRFDSVHQRDEREHPSAGWHLVWEDCQHQLGGCVQIPHHHTPPDGLRQRGQHSSHLERFYCLKVSLSWVLLSLNRVAQISTFFVFLSDLYSIWLQGTHSSTSTIFWTKVASKVHRVNFVDRIFS